MTLLPTRRQAIAAASGLALLSWSAFAKENYPSRPIKMLVPFAPGGGADLAARMLAEGLRLELGQPVVVDNRPGAAGTIGTGAATTAAPDGYTVLFSTTTNQICAPLLMDKPPYDGVKSFTPISLILRYTGAVLVSNSVPGTTFAEFVAYARQRPGKLNFGSSGMGSNNHLLGELLKSTLGVDIVHVPYKGSAAAVQALANDEVQIFVDSVPSAINWLQQGKVRAIALTSRGRSNMLPGIPTLMELGVVSSPADYWVGLFAPPRLPSDLVHRLRIATDKVLASAEMLRFAASGAAEVGTESVEQFKQFLADEQLRWGDVIRKNKLRAS